MELQMQVSSIPDDFHANELFLFGFRVRTRTGQAGMEAFRILAQYALIFMVFFCTLCVLCSSAAKTSPPHVPGAVFEATFGPFSELSLHSPPLMNRTRYEDPMNFWSPVMFQPTSALGWLQDHAYSLWNWGIRSAFFGPLHMKAVAMLATVAIWTPVFGCMVYYQNLVPRFAPRFVQSMYLNRLPEGILILEQLIIAHEKHGRVLSQAIELEYLNQQKL